MSLMTMMLALATGLAVHWPDREAELEAEVDALKTELAQVRSERDAVQEALERQLRREYLETLPLAQMNHQQAMYQNALNQGPAAGMSAMALAQAQDAFCNCVPARHDTFLRGISDL